MPNFRKFKRAKISKKILLAKILILAGLIVITALLIIGNLGVSQKRELVKEKLEILEKEIAELGQREEQLQSEISQASSQDYLEKIAREWRNLKKLGEKVVALPILATREEEEEEEAQNLWENFLNRFIKK